MTAISQYSLFMILLAGARSVCVDQATCEDISKEEVQASAMLQLSKAAPAEDLKEVTEHEKKASTASSLCSGQAAPSMQQTYLTEARTCLQDGLQEAHLQAIRQHAASLAHDGSEAQHHMRHDSSEAQDPTSGSTATLDAAGFLAVTSMCCPPEMEQFFNRLVESMGLQVCSKPHVQGLMHWFSCVPSMDFQYMLDVINNGNPCKYWGPDGEACPALTAQCEGTYCR